MKLLPFLFFVMGWLATPVWSQVVSGRPLYEYKVVVATGDPVGDPATYRTVTRVWEEPGMNDDGRMAVPVHMTVGGSNSPGLVAEYPVDGVLRVVPRSEYWTPGDFADVTTRAASYNNAGHVAWDTVNGNSLGRDYVLVKNLNGPPESLAALRVPDHAWPDLSLWADYRFPSLSSDGHVVAFGREHFQTWDDGDGVTNWVVWSGPDSTVNEYEQRAAVLSAQLSAGTEVENFNYFPVVASGGCYVVVSGRTNFGALLRNNVPGGLVSVASMPLDFEWIGKRVGISGDGRVVSFMGRRAADGREGIFLSVFSDGLASTPFELVGTNTVIGLDETNGPVRFASFNTIQRPMVVVHDRGGDGALLGNGSADGDSILIAFLATPTAASRTNPHTGKPMFFSAKPGVWVARFDVHRGMTATNSVFMDMRAVMPVLQEDDLVEGDSIEEVHLTEFRPGTREANGAARRTADGKPEMGDHVVAIRATTATTTYALKAWHLDTDGDGLPDHWERPTGGVDMNGDGIFDLKLYELGASDMKKDLFVEMDWVDVRSAETYPGGWHNRPTQLQLEILAMDYFGYEPVDNPSGTSGIDLHLDAGPELSMGLREGAPVESLHGGSIVRMPDNSRPDMVVLATDPLPDVVSDPGALRIAHMNQIKETYFRDTGLGARELAFRYCVFADFFMLNYVEDTSTVQQVFTVVSSAEDHFVAAVTAGSLMPSNGLEVGVAMAAIFLDGNVAKQVRMVTVDYPPGSTSRQFTVSLAWGESPFTAPPMPGSRFVLPTSNGGVAEMQDAGTGSGHRLPGNDLLITLGAWGVRAEDRGLALSRVVWSTLAHEVGHTMGLTHGGNNSCAYKGLNHHSRMSYSHQLRFSPSDPMDVAECVCSCPLTTFTNSGFLLSSLYSDGTDSVGIDELRYLRMEPWSTATLVGNQDYAAGFRPFDVHPARDPAPGPDPFETDNEGPRVLLPAPALRAATIGGNLNLSFNVQDVSGVGGVLVRFDANGDGVISNGAERIYAAAAGGGLFSTTISNIAGPVTGRLLTVFATDTKGNSTTRSVVYRVGGFVSGDAAPPVIYFGDANPVVVTMDAMFEVRAQVYEESSAPLGGLDRVEFSFDVDEDGVTNVLTESATGGLDVDGYHRARFRTVGGLPGDRALQIVAEDRAGNRSTNSSVIIRVVPPDSTNPVIVALSPTNNTVVPLAGTGFAVRVVATDESRLKNIRLEWDVDGDGIVTGGTESVAMSYSAGEAGVTCLVAFGQSGVGGGEGARVLQVVVEDFSGRQAVTNIALQVRDTEAPELVIQSPMFDQVIRPGTNFSITGTSSDDQRVTGLVVRVDLDGDGLFNSVGEVVNVSTNESAAFDVPMSGFTGPDGARRVRIEAGDPAGRFTVQEFLVYVAPGVRAWSPLPGDRVAVGSSVMVVVEAPDAASLVMSLDLNGDGDRADSGESVTGRVRSITVQSVMDTRVSEAVLGAVEGAGGTRDLWITGVETSGAPLSLQIPLVVTNDAIFPASRTTRLGSLPVHPDPVTSPTEPAETYPKLIHPFGSGVLYVARTPDAGDTLWCSDGTPTGTRMLKNANPDRFTGGAPVGMGINGFATFQNRVYFNATDQEGGTFSGITGFGNELWVTDGTTGGTYMLKDINPGTATSTDSDPASFIEFGGHLYFAASHSTLGRELWRTDGTATGTVLFADLSPGLIGTGPSQFVEMNGRLWFLVSRLALWSTDGTTTGTVSAIDLPPFGFSSYSVDKLAATTNRLFFEFHDGTSGWELWSSDGSPTGTVLLADIAPGVTSSFPQALTVFSNKMWFTAVSPLHGRELWCSDGSPTGTVLVGDFLAGPSSGNPRNFVTHQGRLWFTATDFNSGEELWSTDGTPGGLRRETEIGRVSGPFATGINATQPGAEPTALVSRASSLFLQADDRGGRNGNELWRLDTNQPPVRVRDFSPVHANRSLGGFGTYTGPDNGAPDVLRADATGRLFMRARDSLYGNQLFVSDGTGTGTRRLGGRVYPRSPPERIEWNGAPLYAVRTGKASRWVRFNGAQLETYPLPLPTGASGLSNIVASANGIAFVADLPPDAVGTVRPGVWTVTSPGAAPVLLKPLTTCWRIFPAGNGWLFTGRDTNSVDRLWRTDGTAPGTLPVTNITVLYGNGYPTDFVRIGTQTLFNISVTAQAEVWISDGSVAGTRRVLRDGTGEMLRYSQLFITNGTRLGLFATANDLTTRFWVLPAINSNAQPIAELAPISGYPATDTRVEIVNGRWILSAISPYTNFPLWSSDGTATGTYGFGFTTSQSLPGGGMVVNPRRLRTIGTSLYFLATHGFNGEEPFVSTCTTGGTRSLGNLYSITAAGANPGSFPRNFTSLGSWVLFVAADRIHGEELWRTDGTDEGTVFLKDIYPGKSSSEIADLTLVSNRLYFTARSPELGRELWSTDGTTQGTLPVQDLLPGPASTYPRDLLTAGTNLLFLALDGADDPSLHRLETAAQPLTPYEQWLATFAPSPAFTAAPWLDGDADDWSNEMEYLFATDPTDPKQHHPVRATTHLLDNTLHYITLTYQRPANWSALGLWFSFDGGYFLDNFSPVATEVISIVPAGTLEHVTVKSWVPGSYYTTYFLSLRIHRD